MSVDMAAAEHALSKAKVQLMDRPDTAFYTTIVFSLKFRWDESIPTAATDGVTLWINPEFFLGLTQGLRMSVLVHEAQHVAYDHMGRIEERTMPKWNWAADYVINWQQKERGFEIGEDWLCDPQYKDMSAEEVYAILPEQLPPPPSGGGGGSGSGQGASSPGNDIKPTPLDQKAHEKHIGDVLIRAQMQSRASGDRPGTIPGDIEIFINKLLDPVLPWNRILQKYLQKFNRSDWSFRKPSRRFFPRFHMPSLYGNTKLIDLAVAVDISGSVSDHDFNVMVSEIYTILRMFEPEKLTLIQFDTDIKSVNVLKSIRDLMKCKFHGRGGTNVSPVYEWANENKPQVLFIFTDGGFRVYDYDPTCEVVWLIHNNPGFTSHIGKVIHYEIKP